MALSRHGYAKGRAGRRSDDSGVEKGRPGVTAEPERETDRAGIIAGDRQGAGIMGVGV